MQGRERRLRRLADLYGVVETARGVEMQRAMLQLHETEQSLAVQQTMIYKTNIDGRSALEKGDRIGWVSAETLARRVGWAVERLEVERAMYCEAEEAAKQTYLASRTESERMRRLLHHAMTEMKTSQGRQEQAASDDRFLARRRWLELSDSSVGEK
jgi:hypothetical protein